MTTRNEPLVPQIDPYKASFWQLLAFYMKYLGSVWHLLVLVLLLVVVGTPLGLDSIYIPLVSKKMIDQVFPEHNWTLLYWIFVATFVQIALANAMMFLTDVVKYIVSFRLGMKIGMIAFRHLHKMSLAFIENKPVGEHLFRIGTSFDPQLANLAWIGLIFEQYGSAVAENAPRISYDIDVVIGMVTQIADLILRVLIQLLLTIGLVGLMIGPELGWALAIFTVPYLMGVHYLYGLQRHSEARMRHLSEEYLAEMQQSLAGIQTVKAYGKTRMHLLRNARCFVSLCRRQGFYYVLKVVTDNYLNIMKYSFICGAYYYSVAYRNITLGAGVALYGLLIQLFNPINMAVRVIEGVRIQMVAARRLMETLGARSEVVIPDEPIPVLAMQGPLDLEKVHFRYLPDFPILKGVTLNIKPGHKTVLVGPSGSGKSSMANLILRFYDPNSGQVKLDGTSLRNVDLVKYYDTIGMVLQDDFLFSGTVRDNVIYGKRLATQEEVELACKVAGIHNEILQMPKGYDTFVGEGSGLSGGQMQRIALARAFVRRPGILMLDEATRALDARLHEVVLSGVDSEFKDSTRVMITHATNDARNADHVIYLERGEVKEEGTYDELIRRGGAFAAMVEAERGRELEEEASA